MKVLLTGAGGQLGQALLAAAPDNVELISKTRQELDLSDADACRIAVESIDPIGFSTPALTQLSIKRSPNQS